MKTPKFVSYSRSFAAFFLLFSLSLLAQDAAPVSPQPAVHSYESISAYILGPGDTINIRALHMEEITDKPVRIGTGGVINLPMLGRIKAAGMTVDDLEAEITSRLKNSVNDPQVAVTVSEYRSQPVSILGSVRSPGVIQLEGRKTLFEVLSLAGGLNSDAGYAVKITRRSEWGDIPLPGAAQDPSGKFSIAKVNLKSVMEARNPEENILICPHDVISVPKGELVYVIGDVRKSGGFVLSDRETVSVLQALALAEGLERTASPQKAKVLRNVPGSQSRTEISLDLKKIMAGQSSDVALQSDDILFVPGSAFKRSALSAIQTAVSLGTGIAIWRRY